MKQAVAIVLAGAVVGFVTVGELLRDPGVAAAVEPKREKSRAERIVDDLNPNLAALFTNVDDNKFGISRMDTLVGPHTLGVRLSSQVDAALREGWQLELFLAGSGTDRANSHIRLQTPFARKADPAAVRDLAKFVQANFGKEVTAEVGGKQVLTRNIAAMHASCISCHTKNKVGEPLGQFVYTLVPRDTSKKQ